MAFSSGSFIFFLFFFFSLRTSTSTSTHCLIYDFDLCLLICRLYSSVHKNTSFRRIVYHFFLFLDQWPRTIFTFISDTPFGQIFGLAIYFVRHTVIWVVNVLCLPVNVILNAKILHAKLTSIAARFTELMLINIFFSFKSYIKLVWVFHIMSSSLSTIIFSFLINNNRLFSDVCLLIWIWNSICGVYAVAYIILHICI